MTSRPDRRFSMPNENTRCDAAGCSFNVVAKREKSTAIRRLTVDAHTLAHPGELFVHYPSLPVRSR